MIVSLKDNATFNSSAVITTAKLKGHLRVTHSDEDTLIDAYRQAACEFVHAYCNTRIKATAVTAKFSGFSAQLELPCGPATSITSIKYRNAGGALTTMDFDNVNFDINRSPVLLRFKTIPDVDPHHPAPVEIVFAAGYATPPEPLVQAVRFLVAHFYENRQAAEVANVREIPMGVYALLNPYRAVSFL